MIYQNVFLLPDGVRWNAVETYRTINVRSPEPLPPGLIFVCVCFLFLPIHSSFNQRTLHTARIPIPANMADALSVQLPANRPNSYGDQNNV